MTVPAPVIHPGEVVEPGPDTELEEAAAKAVRNMDYLAWRADMEGVPPLEPGPNYQPGFLQFCQLCNTRRHRGDCR